MGLIPLFEITLSQFLSDKSVIETGTGSAIFSDNMDISMSPRMPDAINVAGLNKTSEADMNSRLSEYIWQRKG